MHVAFVTHAYPRWDGDVAGTFIERLATALTARGHRITVIAPSDEGRGGPELRSGIDVLRVRYATPERETLAYRGTMVEATRSLGGKVAAISLTTALSRPIKRLMRASRVDVVHAHWWIPSGVAAWLAHRGSPSGYVVTMHGTDVRLLGRSRALASLAGRVLRNAGVVTAVSSYLVDGAARSTGLARDKIVVQPMPADLARFNRKSRGGGGVVTVGRLVAQKRIDTVLESVARLKEDGLTVPLTVIGDGPLRVALEEHAARLGIATTTKFTGEVAPNELSQAIGEADAFVFAAEGEGLGLAAAEALILGIPVVATEGGGGVRDIVPATGPGRIVRDGDPDGMAAAVAELLSDNAAREQAVEAGEELRRRLDPDMVAKRFEGIYADALGTKVAQGA